MKLFSIRSRGFAFVRFYDKHDAEVSRDDMKMLNSWLELSSISMSYPEHIEETQTTLKIKHV